MSMVHIGGQNEWYVCEAKCQLNPVMYSHSILEFGSETYYWCIMSMVQNGGQNERCVCEVKCQLNPVMCSHSIWH